MIRNQPSYFPDPAIYTKWERNAMKRARRQNKTSNAKKSAGCKTTLNIVQKLKVKKKAIKQRH